MHGRVGRKDDAEPKRAGEWMRAAREGAVPRDAHIVALGIAAGDVALVHEEDVDCLPVDALGIGKLRVHRLRSAAAAKAEAAGALGSDGCADLSLHVPHSIRY